MTATNTSPRSDSIHATPGTITRVVSTTNNDPPPVDTAVRRPRRMKRRTFTICPVLLRPWMNPKVSCISLFSIPKRQRFMDFLIDSFSTFLEWFVYGIGPLLIVLAVSIILVLSYTFFHILLPMIYHKHLHHPYRSLIVLIHCTIVLCILINVLFNYTCCVIQKHDGILYANVLEELAAITNIILPKTKQELANYRRDLIERLSQRMKQLESSSSSSSSSSSQNPPSEANPDHVKRRVGVTGADPLTSSSSTVPPTPPRRSWMLLGPYEWGYCSHSHQVKPPRAHYDHVTKTLILNLDHYCPWMFNAIGYFNYRYFVNFLIFTMIGMIYGAFVLWEPFLLSKSPIYHYQVQMEQKFLYKKNLSPNQVELFPRMQPMVPWRAEKIYITLSFMLCVAVGIALIGLGGFHIYLVSTGQTTIEFHANWSQRRRRKQKGKISPWQNPYSRGTRLSNWQQVYGTSSASLLQWIRCGPEDHSWMNLFCCLLLPHAQLPQFLPVPIPGQCTRRPPRVEPTAAIPRPRDDDTPWPVVENV